MNQTTLKAYDDNRVLFIDVLKIISLTLMPIIHSIASTIKQNFYVGDINTLKLHEHILYLFVPGIFLFCMGSGIVLSKHNTPLDSWNRGKHLLLIGLLLNIFRGSLMFSLGGDLVDKNFYETACEWLWGSDILFFAGLFFLLLAILKKFDIRDRFILIIAVIFSLLSGIIKFTPTNKTVIDALLGNIIYVKENSFFPIISWTIYPVLGYLFMKKYIEIENKNKFVLKIGIISAITFIATFTLLKKTGLFKERYILWGAGEFIMDIPTTILTIGIEGAYICLIYYLTKLIKNETIINFITSTSINVSKIYCIHWILINWGLFFNTIIFNKKWSSVISVYLTGVIIFIISTVLAKLIKKFTKNLLKGTSNNFVILGMPSREP